MPHDGDRAASKIGKAGDDRAVVGEVAVAVYLDKVAHQQVDVVERLRPIGMAREANALDRAAWLRGWSFDRRNFDCAIFSGARFMSVRIRFQFDSRLKNFPNNATAS